MGSEGAFIKHWREFGRFSGLAGSQSIPIGILGALCIVTACYMLMSTALVTMVPLGMIDTGAPFSEAFAAVGMPWAKYIVALGALMGIVTGTCCHLVHTEGGGGGVGGIRGGGGEGIWRRG